MIICGNPTKTMLVLGLVILVVSSGSTEPSRTSRDANIVSQGTLWADNTTFIDANMLLMFVTNHGNIGRDLSGRFGYDYGTFFPYSSVTDIESGLLTTSPLYAAGLWLGGRVGSEIRIAVSEYDCEYVPGPMEMGTYMTDRPEFHVYKLFADSLSDNPNYDYTNWPIDQGAPVDDHGYPLMIGDQMLWSVFNDADPWQHINDAGETDPLGVEVHQTVWARDESGHDTIYIDSSLEVHSIGTSPSVEVLAWVANTEAINGHTYHVTFSDTAITGADTVISYPPGEDPDTTITPWAYEFAWHLIDYTQAESLYTWQRPNTICDPIDGIQVQVIADTGAFHTFLAVANASGPLEPPSAAALAFQDFPIDPESSGTVNPLDYRQQVGDGRWAIHTADDGGTSGGGTRGSYEVFLERVLRDDNAYRLGEYDYEMRFTGSYDFPGVGGSYAVDLFDYQNVFWVPFELWRVGKGTPEDPSDDLRLPMHIIDDGLDSRFSLDNYGSSTGGTCAASCEHSASTGDDDPWTDWIYWLLPTDTTPGEAGYLANETQALAGMYDASLIQGDILSRIVLINWNGGQTPPFTQDCPEQGTVFRIVTRDRSAPEATFYFTSQPPRTFVTGPDGLTIYIKYKLYNRGPNEIDSMYISLWADSDLGSAPDDLVGCDTLDDLMFCYNATGDDLQYGQRPPAIGFKALYGPLVPSPGDSANFDGTWIHNYENSKMSAFASYINGTDPDNYLETYNYMRGLGKDGSPYVNPTTGQVTTFMCSGDPVTGTGDVDHDESDRRMMATFGPIDFNPGDSQFVLIRMSVAQGADRLASITRLREIINLPYDDIPTDVEDKDKTSLPVTFALQQNYPNPFNPSTQIDYSLPQRAHVTLAIYNILGRKVVTLVDSDRPAGSHTVIWDGTDLSGGSVATGVYFYRIDAGEYTATRKMILIK